jgi:hypothetical protein
VSRELGSSGAPKAIKIPMIANILARTAGMIAGSQLTSSRARFRK